MKLRRSLLTIGFAFSILGLAQADPLRDQLKLAQDNSDPLAQTEIIQRILQDEPHNPQLRENLADLWLALGDYDQAERAVQDENLITPAVRARVLAQVLFFRDGKKPEAIALLTDYHAKAPDDLVITRQLADYLVATSQYQALVALLDQAPGVKGDPALLLSRANARRALLDFDGAIRDFRAANSLDPNSKAVVDQRPSFERLAEAQGHIQSASAALQKNPADPAALLTRAYWYLYAGSANTLASVDAKAALQLEPNFAAARLLDAYSSNLAGPVSPELIRKESHIDVTKPLPGWPQLDLILRGDQSLKQQPRDAKALTARALQLNAAQQYLLAQDDADAALALAANDPAARQEKIFALVKLGQFDPAAVEFRLLETNKPPADRLARAANFLSEAAFADSRLEVALDFANRAIKAQPASAAYYKQRAAILQRLNRRAEASADLAKANALTKKAAR